MDRQSSFLAKTVFDSDFAENGGVDRYGEFYTQATYTKRYRRDQVDHIDPKSNNNEIT